MDRHEAVEYCEERNRVVGLGGASAADQSEEHRETEHECQQRDCGPENAVDRRRWPVSRAQLVEPVQDDPPEGEGKYKLPPTFQKSRVLFNLHHVRAIPDLNKITLCEGYFDVLEWWQHGLQNAVAIMGSSMSEEQLALIVETVGPEGRVTLMFDDDPAGRMCTDDTLTRLSQRVYVKVGIVS